MKENLRKNFIWNTIGTTLAAFNSLFFLIIVIRYNKVDIGGIYSFGFALACLLGYIGFYHGRVYQVVNKQISDDNYIITRIACCIIMLLSAFIYSISRQYSLFKLSVIMLLCFYKSMEALFESFYAIFQRNNRLFIVGISMTLKSILSLLSFLIIEIITHNLILSLFGIILSYIIVFFAYDYINIRKQICLKGIDLSSIKEIIKGGFFPFAISFLMMYLSSASKYIIDFKLADEFQTIFSIIIMPATIVVLFCQYIIQPYITWIEQLYKNKKNFELKKCINKILVSVFAFGLFAIIAGYFLGIPVLNFIYNLDLAKYKMSFIIILTGAISYGMATIISSFLTAINKNRIQALIYTISACISTIVTITLINNYELLGAAIAYSCSMTLLLLILIIYIRRVLKTTKLEKMKGLVDKNDIISFDIYDTLVYRNALKPTDVFDMVETLYNSKYDKKISNFKSNRMIAQANAYKKSLKEEITIKDIYLELVGIYDNSILSELKKIEIDIEENICVANKEMQELYNYCMDQNKTIIIISDMYLSKNIIEKILNQCGYNKYNLLYVSSNTGKRKSRGKIYKYLKDKKIINKKTIHFGDNLLGDFLMPILNKIKAYYYKNKEFNNTNFYNKKKSKNINYLRLEKFINNNIDVNKNYYFKMGYETLGPILYGFINLIYKEANGETIYFFSRDGFLMQKAYNIISNNSSSKYFYASRRALIIPSLWLDDNMEQMLEKFNMPGTLIKVKNVFYKLGCETKIIEREYKKSGLPDEIIMNYREMINDERFLKLYKRLLPSIIENSKKEYKILLKYLKQEEITHNSMIVDIGWNGNMQRALNNIFEYLYGESNLRGYYIGILPDSKNIGKLNMNDYLFDKGKNEEVYWALKSINSIFESMFLAPHGTVKNYKEEAGKVLPVLKEYEYKEGLEKKSYEEIQEGALAFIKDYTNSLNSKYYSYSSNESFYNMEKFAYYPTCNDVKEFGDFCFLDDELIYIAKPKILFKYMINPKGLIKDLFKCGWNVGFMKRLTKIDFFYATIYKIMIKVYKRKCNR